VLGEDSIRVRKVQWMVSLNEKLDAMRSEMRIVNDVRKKRWIELR
jgi:hypothetical protein